MRFRFALRLSSRSDIAHLSFCAFGVSTCRTDPCVAREVMVALPHELDEAQRLSLVRGFVQREFVDAGMVADFSIHEPSRQGDERNYHCHIMLTMRPIEGDGFGAKKERAWNRDKLLQHWRASWAEHCNAALEEAGHDARIDHRSFEAQGIDREPTEHMGKNATAAERKGQTTERGDRNREARGRNRELDELVDELAVAEAEIAAAEERRLDRLYGPDDGLVHGLDPDARPDLTDSTTELRLSEEEKRLTRRAFEPEPADPEFDRPLSEDDKRHARSAIADAEVTDREIGSGEIRHGGLGMSWWQHTALFMTRIGEHVMERVIEPAVEAVQDAWQQFVRRDDRDDINRDNGPDFER
jgi:MobA/MobL family